MAVCERLKQTDPCPVCNHVVSEHHNKIRGPKKQVLSKNICLVIIGSGPLGMDVACSCNGKRSLGLEMMKRIKE